MKTIVYIDGENLSYAIRKALSGDKNNPADREAIINYRFRELIEDALEDIDIDSIKWYGAKIKNRSESLKDKANKFISYQSSLCNTLTKQNIKFCKVGYLRNRTGDVCSSCGNEPEFLTEKGVDVGMAVDILVDANELTRVVVVSADTDLLPAIQAVKEMCAEVIYLGYESQPMTSMVKHSNKTRTITDSNMRRFIHK